MFDSLSNKLATTFKNIRNKGKLRAEDIDQTLQEVKAALLEADVNYKVVKDFCESVRRNAEGMNVIKSLNPGQMVIKYVHDELLKIMGKTEVLNLNVAPPAIIMLVGLQGAGKTTHSAKLAKHLKENNKRNPLLVSVDVYRPAAIEQLKILAENIGLKSYNSTLDKSPLTIAQEAVKYAKNSGFDTVILDTAGRLQIDDKLMNELIDIIEAIEPNEILLTADAMTGQEAVNIAKGFDDCLDLDGIILTKLDGDARGGAALSMRAVTGKPIKFIGVGEHIDKLEIFYPDRLVSRILGMGDMLTFIEKAVQHVDLEEAEKLRKKAKKGDFSLEDFLSQMRTIQNMGSMTSMMKMIPGMGQLAQKVDADQAERELKKIEAIILSMTPQERENHEIIDGSRRKRIARGSGTTVEDINKLLKQFSEMRKMMKQFLKGGNQLAKMRGMASMLRSKV
ncbi:MAG: signal recognition particle protein [Deltaproteobacteria bacterium]|jgi:signal recognition particle subunit SRP54|nr:signal recognition particle protein [Deltaproteobacteria bacterium]